jgi:hypothetical protein
MEGVRDPFMLQSKIPPLAGESRPRARAMCLLSDQIMCVLSEQQGRWKLLRTTEENTWSREIEPKTSAIVPC